MRIACVRIPDFPVWVLRRHDPTLAGVAVVVTPESGRGRILAVSPEARRAALNPGMSLARAQAALPEARLVHPTDELTRTEKMFQPSSSPVYSL